MTLRSSPTSTPIASTTPAPILMSSSRVYGPPPAKMEQTVFPTRRRTIRTYGKDKVSSGARTLKRKAGMTPVEGQKTLKQKTLTQFDCLQSDSYELVGTPQVTFTKDERKDIQGNAVEKTTPSARVRWDDAVVGGEEEEPEVPTATMIKRQKMGQFGSCNIKSTTLSQAASATPDQIGVSSPGPVSTLRAKTKATGTNRDNAYKKRKAASPPPSAPSSSFHTQTLTQFCPGSFIALPINHEIGDSEEEDGDSDSHKVIDSMLDKFPEEVGDSEDNDDDLNMLSPELVHQIQSDIDDTSSILSSPPRNSPAPRIQSPPSNPATHNENVNQDNAVQAHSSVPQTPTKSARTEIPSSQPSPFTPITTRYNTTLDSPSLVRSRSMNSGALSDHKRLFSQASVLPKVSRFPSTATIQDSFTTGTSEGEAQTSPSRHAGLTSIHTRLSPNSPSRAHAPTKSRLRIKDLDMHITEVPASESGSSPCAIDSHRGQRDILQDDIETQDGSGGEEDLTVIPDSEDESVTFLMNSRITITLLDSESNPDRGAQNTNHEYSPTSKSLGASDVSSLSSVPSVLEEVLSSSSLQPPTDKPISSSPSPILSVSPIHLPSESERIVVQDSGNGNSMSDITNSEGDITVIPPSPKSPKLSIPEPPATPTVAVAAIQTQPEHHKQFHDSLEDYPLDQREKEESHSLMPKAQIQTQEDVYGLGAETQAIMHMLASDHTAMPAPPQHSILSHSGEPKKSKTRKRAMFATSSPEIMPMRYYTPTPSLSQGADQNQNQQLASIVHSSQSQYMQDHDYTPAESQRVALHVIQAMEHPTNRTDIFISIHPQYVAQIVNGTKNHEFRKYQIHHEVVRMWIYETRPECQVRYLACIGPPKQVGEIDDLRGLGNVEFNNGDEKSKFAYEILQVYELNNPQSLAVLKEKGWLEAPPQKYTFIAPAIAAQLLANLRHRIQPQPEGENDGCEVFELPSIPVPSQKQPDDSAQNNESSSSQLSSLSLTSEDDDVGLDQSKPSQERFRTTDTVSLQTSNADSKGTRSEAQTDVHHSTSLKAYEFKRPVLPFWRRPPSSAPSAQTTTATSSINTVSLGVGANTGMSFSQATTASQSSTPSSPLLNASPRNSRAGSRSMRSNGGTSGDSMMNILRTENSIANSTASSNSSGNNNSNDNNNSNSNNSNALSQMPPPPLLSSSQPNFNDIESPSPLLATTPVSGPKVNPASGLGTEPSPGSLGLSQLFSGGEFALPHSLIEDQEPPPVISDSEDEGI